VTLSSL